MKLILLKALLVSLVFSGIASAHEASLTACTFPMAPYTIRDSHGKITGLEVDLVKALAKEAGFQAEFIDYPWNRALEMLKSGDLDVLMTMTRTPEREAFTHFLGISTHQQFVLFVRKENAKIRIETLDDLAKTDYLFGIRQHFHYSDEFNSRLAVDETFKRRFIAVAQADQNLKRVKCGRLTGCIGDRILTGYQVRNNKAYNDICAVTLPFFKVHPVYFGVSRKISPEKLETLQKAYHTLEKRGTIKGITRRWIKP